MEEPQVRITQAGAVRTLQLNRPKALNSFTAEMHAAVAQRPRSRRRGCGRALRGADRCRPRLLRRAGPGRPGRRARIPIRRAPPTDIGAPIERHYRPLALQIRSMPVPVVAAVNGVAAGAGANIALGCDIVIAARSASFIQAFSKIGLLPDCRRHLAAAAPGRPRQGPRPRLAGRQARRRGGRAHRPDLALRRRRRVRGRSAGATAARLAVDADARAGRDARRHRRRAAISTWPHALEPRSRGAAPARRLARLPRRRRRVHGEAPGFVQRPMRCVLPARQRRRRSPSSAPAAWAPASPSSRRSAAMRCACSTPSPAPASAPWRASTRISPAPWSAAASTRPSRDAVRGADPGRRRTSRRSPAAASRSRRSSRSSTRRRRCSASSSASSAPTRCSRPTPRRSRSSAIAQGLQHPGRVIGWHFFNPVTRMKLVEVIPGVETDPALAAAMHALCQGLGQDLGRCAERAGLHRQPRRAAVLRRGAAPARRAHRRARGDRPPAARGRRLRDGTVRADRPDRRRRQPVGDRIGVRGDRLGRAATRRTSSSRNWCAPGASGASRGRASTTTAAAPSRRSPRSSQAPPAAGTARIAAAVERGLARRAGRAAANAPAPRWRSTRTLAAGSFADRRRIGAHSPTAARSPSGAASSGERAPALLLDLARDFATTPVVGACGSPQALAALAAAAGAGSARGHRARRRRRPRRHARRSPASSTRPPT